VSAEQRAKVAEAPNLVGLHRDARIGTRREASP
jgi:hypothetical protein